MDQWAFAFEQNGSKFSNKDEACASIETDLPKAFSAVMQDTLQTAKFREFDPKRASCYNQNGKGTLARIRANPQQGTLRETPNTNRLWQLESALLAAEPVHWNERRSQWQRSYPGGSAGKGQSSSSSSSNPKGGKDDHGRRQLSGTELCTPSTPMPMDTLSGKHGSSSMPSEVLLPKG